MLLAGAGLLAAVLMPALGTLQRRAHSGLLRSALRQLAAAEESYFFDHRVYSADPAALQRVGFRPSPGVRIMVHEATLAGWSATATLAGSEVRCSVFVKAAAPVGGATRPGEMRCR